MENNLYVESYMRDFNKALDRFIESGSDDDRKKLVGMFEYNIMMLEELRARHQKMSEALKDASDYSHSSAFLGFE